MKPVSVLLVDDQRRNVTALTAALAGVDCSLVAAYSGREALKCVLAQDFAVIVLDVYMPGMDGFETASLIRARERSHATPIIFLTADDSVGTPIQRGYRAGAVDYMYKPFDADILAAKVAVFVELFSKTLALEERTAALTQVTADLERREQEVTTLNAQLEQRVVDRTAALEAAIHDLETEAAERQRAEATLRALERAAIAEAEIAAARASALAEVSRVLVENFVDHGPMLGGVAHIAAGATDTACVIQLLTDDADDAGLVPLALDHADPVVRAEIARALSVPHKLADSPWQNLDSEFLDGHPLRDSLSVPMRARTALIGTLSLGRFGADAPEFTDSDRQFSDDLTTRVALAVENARLYHAARIAIELRDKFMDIAAHELRTPLTTIQGYSQLLSHQLEEALPQDDSPARRSAHMVQERTRHLARLVEQITDISQLVSSRLHLERGDTEVVGLIRKLVADYASRYASHEYRLHVPHESIHADLDRARVQQVMANLLDNAVRYSPDDGPVAVTVDTDESDSVVLTVRDWGIGIPEEQRPHIFDRFQRVPAVSYRSGMGLGLHISREIVVLHDGEISVTFPADGGTQFTVRLPRTARTIAIPQYSESLAAH